MSDAGWGARTGTGTGDSEAFWGDVGGKAYYPNIFADFADPADSPESYSNVAKQFQALICVDNSLNMDTTDRMSKEAHIYNVSALSFASDSHFNPTAGGMNYAKWTDPAQTGEQFLEAYPKTFSGGAWSQVVRLIPNGLVVQFKNIMLPIHAGAKARVVFVMPSGLFNAHIYSTNTSETENHTGLSPITGNIWNCGVTILEELERNNG